MARCEHVGEEEILKPMRTIALLSREPGVVVLRDALTKNPVIDLVGVFTHGRLPKSEGGGWRPELPLFKDICRQADIPLHVLELAEARSELTEAILAYRPDLLIALSWRSILTRDLLSHVPLGAINLHRGALPQYAGAIPVQRAIENGDRRIAISAIRMVEEVDAGPVLGSVWLDIALLPLGRSSADYAEEIKLRLYPLYAPLANLAIAAVATTR